MIKAVISQGATSHQIELEGPKQNELIGKKIGDSVDGGRLGLPGYTLEITGGSDEGGFAMRRDLQSTGRKKLLLSGGEGFNPERDGERRRKSVHGNTIDQSTIQVNLVVTEEGDRSIEAILYGEEEEEAEEEASADEGADEEEDEE